jgi:hypothetical protein
VVHEIYSSLGVTLTRHDITAILLSQGRVQEYTARGSHLIRIVTHGNRQKTRVCHPVSAGAAGPSSAKCYHLLPIHTFTNTSEKAGRHWNQNLLSPFSHTSTRRLEEEEHLGIRGTVNAPSKTGHAPKASARGVEPVRRVVLRGIFCTDGGGMSIVPQQKEFLPIRQYLGPVLAHIRQSIRRKHRPRSRRQDV